MPATYTWRSLALWGVCFAVSASAQDFLITQPNITTCSGALYDSGGSSGNYGNNESYTTVICPDQPEGRIWLNFTGFNLSTQLPVPVDSLTIYDGNTTAAPRIGSFTSTALFNIIVTASDQNPSGCLTLVLSSNTAGTGNFAAVIGCDLPCPAPTASFSTALGDTVRLCLGDELIVDGSGSQAAPGQALSNWSWNFGTGSSVNSTIALDTLVFNAGGAYPIRLRVQDSAGCWSDPSDPVVVLVSGPPSFVGTGVNEPVCVFTDAELHGHAVPVPLVITGSAGANYGPGIFLPDDVGIPFHSPVLIDQGPTGALINDEADLGDICLDLEHSFMGDLYITLECPNGQSVALYTQGGASTYLGDANDNDTSGNPVPGICWNYCFNANPDHGTWAECSAMGITPNVVALPSGGIALAPGSYQTVGPLTDLIGCPVNGTWTLTITDLWAADNGFLCSWSMGMPVLWDSSFAALSPTLALNDPDSAFWSVNGGVGLPGQAALATAPITTSGPQAFTFTVIDSYGCTYDTTITVIAPDLLLDAVYGPVTANPFEALVYTTILTPSDADSIVWALPPGWTWNDASQLDATAEVIASGTAGLSTICATAYGAGCAGNEVCLDIDLLLGMTDGTRGDPLLVAFPNPTDGMLTLLFPSGSSVHDLVLTDMVGQRLALAPIRISAGLMQFDLHGIAPGAYVLSAVCDEQRLFVPVVRSR